tara:strand:+ start:1765 stop:2241 length:477 start_codon:yes stop_codon:yes gene_type:complete
MDASEKREIQTVGYGLTWEDYTVGERYKTLGRTITEADIINFIGVTGMNEVLFTDHTFTIGVAAAGRAAPAALTYSLIEGIICQYLIQGTGLAMLELQKRILAPVVVGDTVYAEIEVLSVRKTSKGNRGIVKTRNDILNQRGDVVITYEATRMVAGKD